MQVASARTTPPLMFNKKGRSINEMQKKDVCSIKFCYRDDMICDKCVAWEQCKQSALAQKARLANNNLPT